MGKKTMAYEYVRSYYGVTAKPGQRVTTKDGLKSGVIARKKIYDQYVYVTFDGSKFSVPCHQLDLRYQEEAGAAVRPTAQILGEIEDSHDRRLTSR